MQARRISSIRQSNRVLFEEDALSIISVKLLHGVMSEYK